MVTVTQVAYCFNKTAAAVIQYDKRQQCLINSYIVISNNWNKSSINMTVYECQAA